jgi:pimeloyl-ACP methyl ester carboxylesterase
MQKRKIMATTTSRIEVTTKPLTGQNKRGCLFYIKRGLLALFILIVALPAAGFLYETVMAAGDDQRFPPPGQLVSVDGHQMHIRCVGEGSPTVIFEPGLGGWSDSWLKVQPEVGAFTRACSYDHAGLGWSEPSNQPRTQAQIATELHDLLVAAHIQPPYILVGQSMGGKSIRLFAAQYPEEVAGMVFVDARHESVEPTNGTPEQNAQARTDFENSLNLYRVLRETGFRLFAVPLARMIEPSLKTLPDEVVYQQAVFAAREQTLQTEAAESRESTANDDQLRAAVVPHNLPVFVLSADASLAGWDVWKIGQQHLAALSSNSQWLIVKNSSHHIEVDQPQAIIDAVQHVFEAAQTGKPLVQ